MFVATEHKTNYLILSNPKRREWGEGRLSDNKKYYYLKLRDNFFESDSMIVLESMPDGYLYSNILLKLYLRSLKTEGRLMFNDRIPYNSQMLAKITRHQVGTVEKAIQTFRSLDLIEVLETGAIYITDIQNYIGRSSTEADRKRVYREKISTEKSLQIGQMSGQMSDVHPPEIEIEIEIEKDIDKNTMSGNPDFVPEIINYLNKKTGSRYKSSTPKTRKLIGTRLKEGFSVDDFKSVIDKKCAEWLNSQMAQYLRPETLFGTKFEGYLNQTVVSSGNSRIDTVNRVLQKIREEDGCEQRSNIESDKPF